MSPLVKICGITDEDGLASAVANGADFIGMVFFPPSPRFITPEQAAELVDLLPDEVRKVGLFVDPDDATLHQVLSDVRFDLIQLHGTESPERVEDIRQEWAVPVMKMIPVSAADDLIAAEAYFDVADWLLFDARPPAGSTRPGGNAVAFDWSILQGRSWPLPWMLAGGLTPENVADAIRASGAQAVDVSSGVEDRPGVKSADRIRAFIDAVESV